MAKANKTKPEPASVDSFLEQIEPSTRRDDGIELTKLFTKVTGQPATLWGSSILGFGSYHYRYESGHSGSAPRVAFSPRKAKLVCYVKLEGVDSEALLLRLGKHTKGKGCLYINKLSDIDLQILEDLISASWRYMAQTYPI
ncbi:DUF1801 domain-containing protein [Candidatus Phycosocius spiralis]|nr:DUF1801 domain-containing protein [Candidatus Phycosocius spiralis]